MYYYKTLGVNRNASQDEIKKAFKKQAMKHHPDKGGDANTFQQINEAYETLGNSNKKQQYDMFGTTGNQNPRTQTWEFGGDFPNDIGVYSMTSLVVTEVHFKEDSLERIEIL